MADDDITSLLEEYSIADDGLVAPSEIQRESLRDAFSRYAKVIFHDISDSYPTDADVQCFFSMAPDMKHKDGDVVGLFRLGWRSPSDMVTSQVVPKPTTEDQHDFQVQFRASELPKDEGEIYQLCYISQGEVWGASVPFEFRRATAEELLVVDSGDIAIVISQSAVAEDLKCQLINMRKDLTAAEATTVATTKQLKKVQEDYKVLMKQLNDYEKVEQVMERLKADNQALDEARNASEEKVRDAEFTIHGLNCLVSALQRDVEILQKQINIQADEIANQKGLVAQRDCSQDLIDALREGKELAVRELRAVMAENGKISTEKEQLIEEKKDLHDKIGKLKEDYRILQEAKEKSEIAHTKRIEELLVQLTQLTSDAQQRVGVAVAETEHFKKQVTTLQTELETKDLSIQALNAQFASECSMLSEDFPGDHEGTVDHLEILELQRRLKDVRARYKEVRCEIQTLMKEMDVLRLTEENLLQSHDRLTNRVNALQNIIREAENCGNTLDASLHQREMGVAQSKLEEKKICLESAHQRRDELRKQLKELEQERAVLVQQEVEAVASLATLESTDSEFYQNDPLWIGLCPTEREREAAQIHSRYHREVEDIEDVMKLEVTDLQERLRQAAEAYKLLYTEKMLLAQQLAHMQNLERQREMQNEH